MKYEYFFTIAPGNSPSLLQDSLEISGEDICFLREEEDDKETLITFSSIHLNAVTNPLDIWNIGESLRRIYTGAKIILNGYFHHDYRPDYSFRLVDLWTSKDHRRITPANIEERIPMFPFSSIKTMRPQDDLAQLVYMSKEHKDILSLLIQFGSGTGWINLHSILDTIEHHSKNNKIDVIKANNLGKKIGAFTGMANNFGLLGVNARHGDKGWLEPQKSITLKDAESTIIELTRLYLNEIYKLNIPPLRTDTQQSQSDIWTFDFKDF